MGVPLLPGVGALASKYIGWSALKKAGGAAAKWSWPYAKTAAKWTGVAYGAKWAADKALGSGGGGGGWGSPTTGEMHGPWLPESTEGTTPSLSQSNTYSPTTYTPPQQQQAQQTQELRHPVTGAVGAVDPRTGDIVYGPMAEDILSQQQAGFSEVEQAQTGFQEILDGYQLAGINIPSVPDFREDINWMREQMQQAPEIPDLRSEMDRLRMEYQVEPLEQKIHEYDRDLLEAEKKYADLLGQEEGRAVSLEVMRGRSGEISEEMRRELGYLDARKNLVINELNSKYNIINTMMGLTTQQYELARQDYEMKFNQNFNMLGLMMDNQRYNFEQSLGLAKTAYDIQQIEQQTAMANWQTLSDTIFNAIASGSLENFDMLTSEQKARLSQMETQAGLPTGITSTVLKNLKPQEQIVSSTMSHDNTLMSLLIREPNGVMKIVNLSTGLPAAPVSPGISTDKWAAETEYNQNIALAVQQIVSAPQEEREGRLIEITMWLAQNYGNVKGLNDIEAELRSATGLRAPLR